MGIGLWRCYAAETMWFFRYRGEILDDSLRNLCMRFISFVLFIVAYIKLQRPFHICLFF